MGPRTAPISRNGGLESLGRHKRIDKVLYPEYDSKNVFWIKRSDFRVWGAGVGKKLGWKGCL